MTGKEPQIFTHYPWTGHIVSTEFKRIPFQTPTSGQLRMGVITFCKLTNEGAWEMVT